MPEVDKLLRFWGIDVEEWRVKDLRRVLAPQSSSPGIRIIAAAAAIEPLLCSLGEDNALRRDWSRSVHSVFIHGGEQEIALAQVAELVAGPGRLLSLNGNDVEFVVTDTAKNISNVMSGVRLRRLEQGCDRVWSSWRADVIPLLTATGGAALLLGEYHSVPVFISTARAVIDLDSPLVTPNFDVRKHATECLPLVLYIKWAFPANAPVSNANACFVIDDPLLRPRHGFLRFESLAQMMRREGFSATVAFVPWNRRRTDEAVARLFRNQPDQLSLCIHGCDHTKAEFGCRKGEGLVHKVCEAINRMDEHAVRTGIGYDRVMVFPQGIFSEDTLQVLKDHNFVAAVNTDLRSTDGKPLKLRDAWDTARRGHGFAVFGRRYASDGIENFAFDMLLGKPCLIGSHHDLYRDNNVHAIELVRRLNALNCALSWHTLGEVIRRSYRCREAGPERVDVEMFGAEVRLQNQAATKRQFVFTRREPQPAAVAAVHCDGAEIRWQPGGERITFSRSLGAGETRLFHVSVKEDSTNGAVSDSLIYRFKTAIRRYAAEARDNHLAPLFRRFSRADL